MEVWVGVDGGMGWSGWRDGLEWMEGWVGVDGGMGWSEWRDGLGWMGGWNAGQLTYLS